MNRPFYFLRPKLFVFSVRLAYVQKNGSSFCGLEMKKLFVAGWLLFLFSSVSFAQENQAVWQFYKGAANEFSAEFPSLVKSSRIMDLEKKKEFGNLYKTYFNKTFYFVAVCETMPCPQFEIVKNLKFRSRNAENSKFIEKTLESDVLETSFVDAEGFHQKIRQIRTEKNYFILHTVGETAVNEDAERFLNSFRLPPVSEQADQADQEKHDRWLVTESAELKLLPQSETIIEPQTTSKYSSAKKVTMTPVSILNKPPASYTDAARYYEISGQVVLRVTFLANKSISTVTPLKKLPFGLTEQATAAVKEIGFAPALRDGKPVSVFKPVFYTFSIN
jgi:hypothetical protein